MVGCKIIWVPGSSITHKKQKEEEKVVTLSICPSDGLIGLVHVPRNLVRPLLVTGKSVGDVANFVQSFLCLGIGIFRDLLGFLSIGAQGSCRNSATIKLVSYQETKI